MSTNRCSQNANSCRNSVRKLEGDSAPVISNPGVGLSWAPPGGPKPKTQRISTGNASQIRDIITSLRKNILRPTFWRQCAHSPHLPHGLSEEGQTGPFFPDGAF